MTTPNSKLTSSSGKHSQYVSGNSPNAKEGKKKRGDVCIYPICTENIIKQIKNRKEQDATFCDRLCKVWLHRQCAGLSTIIFNE